MRPDEIHFAKIGHDGQEWMTNGMFNFVERPHFLSSNFASLSILSNKSQWMRHGWISSSNFRWNLSVHEQWDRWSLDTQSIERLVVVALWLCEVCVLKEGCDDFRIFRLPILAGFLMDVHQISSFHFVSKLDEWFPSVVLAHFLYTKCTRRCPSVWPV